MRRILPGTILLLIAFALFAGCGGVTGDDDTPPSSTLYDPPNYIFFNGGSETVLFRGEASDNRTGFSVEISFDGGGTFFPTDVLDAKDTTVNWSYAAAVGDILHGGTIAIRTRAVDKAGNIESPPLWSVVTATQNSTTVSDLESFFASASTVLYLSSGTGGAYGTTASGPALVNSNDLIVVGSGYGQALTADGFSAVDATPQTALATSDSAAFLFSTGADLILDNLRLVGGDVGVKAATAGSRSIAVVDCVLTGQEEWAFYAEDTGGAADDLLIALYGSMIDASAGTGTDHGGIYLGGVADYDVFDSMVKGSTLTSGVGGAVFAESGDGIIESNVFFRNAPAVWISDGAPTISYNIMDGNAATDTRGINITDDTGQPKVPEISFNDIFNNDSYGVRIQGGTAPVFFRNVVTDNQESGFIFDGSFIQTPLPDLGNSLFPNSTGFNSIFGNSYLDEGLATNDVFVVSGSSPITATITAHNNYWANANEASIKGLLIIDGQDLTCVGCPIISVFSPEGSNPNPGRP
ncbi:MAG: right-handed parallel beta-helix repeat-containing protein [bacterium]|nr:MAG: right-handed parallel beta-helix repeat-containing protein [bacterium]